MTRSLLQQALESITAPPAPDAQQQQLLIEVIAAHHKLYFENETLRRDLGDMTAQRDRLAMRYDALEARSDGDRMDARRYRAFMSSRLISPFSTEIDVAIDAATKDTK